MNKKIILVGPSAAGKDFIRNKFREKGFRVDISYTSRPLRDTEIDGIDYHFIGDEFPYRISQNDFYEYIKHGEYWYGTGMREWNNSEVFIMETEGLKHISAEERKNSLVIFINTPQHIRIKRMKQRGWDNNKMRDRIMIDENKFQGFTDFDIEICSMNHMSTIV